MSERRREKELKRKRKAERDEKTAPLPAPPSAERTPPVALGRDVLTRELADPARLVVHLRRLSELLTVVDELRGARVPPVPLTKAILAVPPAELAALPENERAAKLRARLATQLADATIARNASLAFDATLAKAREPADRLALIAGKTFIESWRRSQENAHLNPAWEAIFGISILDTIFEGHLLGQIVRDSWKVDEGAAAKAFAKALARAEVAKELDSLGLEERDPQALARSYGALARDQEKTFLLGFDSVLHLVRANATFAAAHVKTLLAQGATDEVRAAALAAFEASYKDDVTVPLAHDLANEVSRHLQALAKGESGKGPTARGDSPEEAKRIALLSLTSLRALPVEENALLRGTYLGSFEVYKNVAPAEEVPFIRRVWAEPDDRWALEEYEKFLIERRHAHRADRVRRYLASIRREGRAPS